MDFNFNYCGKSVLDKKKKTFEAAGNYLAEEREMAEAKERALNEDGYKSLLSSAAYSQNSSYLRGKERAKRLQESLEYTDKATKNAMTEYIATIVENSLLIDASEYEKINPNYKRETRELIREFLEKADLNTNITNKHTLSIMEHVSRNLPDVKTGVLLNEDEVTGMVTRAQSVKVDDDISALANDVQNRVADTVKTEQGIQDEIQDDLNKIITLGGLNEATKKIVSERKGAPKMEEAPEELPPEEMPPEELPPEEAPVEELPPEEDPAMIGSEPTKSVNIAPDGTVSVSAQNKEVSIGADGSLNVNIFERTKFVEEIPKQGLLETLAVNEGMKMIAEGKEYNGDLALANAINYVTVLETFNIMGLLEFDTNTIKNMIRLGGGVTLAKKKSLN